MSKTAGKRMLARDSMAKLIRWSKEPQRAPLLLRGARQVGKSWLVKEFGKSFDHFIEINFEKQISLMKLFEGDIEIPTLLEKIELYTGSKIIPGKTLLFFDEIQECEAAINYLRYFKEEYPALHVIAAGSLLDFKLKSVGLPVGRVDFLFLTPLSFSEYLTACDHQGFREFLYNQDNDPVIANRLKDLLHTYFWLGGMPAVVQAWVEHHDVGICHKIQDRLILAYKGDFEKYVKERQMPHVEKIFTNIPAQFGEKFKYATVDGNLRSVVLKQALYLLEKAGIAHISYHSSAQRPPLAANADEKHFKVFFSDIGLAQRLLGTTYQDWIINKIKVDNVGGLAEQFVAQEIIAYRSHYEKEQLYYWHREAKNSNAEVDFVVTRNSQLIPIEVKSGSKGTLKSMQIYLDTHPHSPYGLKIFEGKFDKQDNLVEIPLYGIESWLKLSPKCTH